MVARSGSVADPRWSPAGAHLAWIARRTAGRISSSRRRRERAAGRRHRRRRCRRGLCVGHRRRARGRGGRRPARGRPGHRRRRAGAHRRRPGRGARGVEPGRGRVRARPRRRVRHRDRADRRPRMAGARVAGRLRVGSGVVARRRAARVARVGPPRHAVGRVAHRRPRPDGATKNIAGGEAIAVGQPRFGPDGGRLAYISDARLVDDLDRRHRRRARSRCCASRANTPNPRGGRGSARTRGLPTASGIAWCRNEDGFGRLVIATPGRQFCARAVEGLAPRARLGRAGDRVCAFGRGDAVASGRARGQRIGRAARRARSGRRLRVDAARRAAARSRTSPATRRCTRCCTGLRRTTRPPLVVHLHGGPTGQATADWNATRAVVGAARFAVLQPNYRGSTGYGRAYTQSLSGRWGERDVADVAAGIRYTVKDLGVDPARVVLMGGSAGGFTALLVAALHPDLVQGVIALYPVTDLLDLAATTHRFESGYHLRLVGPLPDTVARYRAISGHDRRRRSARRSCCCTGAPTIRASRAVGGAGGAAARTVNGTSTRARATAGAAPRRSPTSSARIDAFLTHGSRPERMSEYEYQGPKRGADRAVLLAHGAGADMHAAALTTVADALADAKVPSLRFNFPYMAAGRRGPDRPPVLAASVRDAAAELARRTKLPPDRLVLGGRSMGGRICSLVVADEADPVPALGLVLLGYPLHPPGQARDAAGRALPAHHGAVPLRVGYARLVRDARRTATARAARSRVARNGTGSSRPTTGSSR